MLCLAHIINLIVKDVLKTLKSDNTDDVDTICDGFDCDGDNTMFSSTLNPLARIRILAVWIQRSPERCRLWKETCKSLGDVESMKFIEYDVPTRWNSTFRMANDALPVSGSTLQGTTYCAKLTVNTLKACRQVEAFMCYETTMTPFSNADWEKLESLAKVLSEFNSLSNFVFRGFAAYQPVRAGLL